MSTMTQEPRHHILARWALIGAIILVLGIAIAESLRFPGIFTPPAVAALYLGIFVLTLIAYAITAVVATRTRSPAADVALMHALRWGAVVGVLWWIEILEANVWRLSGLWLALLYFGPAIAACTVPGIAAAVTVRQTGRFRSGLAAGMWSGMIGGLLTFLGGTAILWAFNASFLHDPQNLQEFLRSYARGLAPDLQTYIVGDLLAGLIAHLTLIGIVISAIAGIIGATVGQRSAP
jgi:hypothetical protein